MLDFIIITLIFCFAFMIVEMKIDISKNTSKTDKSLRTVFLFIIFVLTLVQSVSYNYFERKIKEKAVIEFVNGSVTYDTLTMNKNGNILAIRLIEKK